MVPLVVLQNLRSKAALMTAAAVGAAVIAGGVSAQAENAAARGTPTVTSDNGYYFWIDGMADKTRLPAYQLGLHNISGLNDAGPIQHFDPRLDGAGVRSAIGYLVPATSVKLELGGSYVEAKDNRQLSSASNGFVGARFLNGSGMVGITFDCSFPVTIGCTTAGSLSTDYTAWQFNGKVSADWKFAGVTVTPHVAVFGGNSRVEQTLSQFFSQPFAGNTGTYSAATTESWRDIGARVGADLGVEVAKGLTLDIGGWIGGANRHTSLSGSDAGADSTGNTVFGGGSTLSIDDSRMVVLTNAETGFAYRPLQMVALRGFVGLNHDSRVPGIANPSFTGSFGAPTSTTAASITYTAETSYYAGGGLLMNW